MRLPDWPERLAAVVDRHRAAPAFQWGAYDCATLFAEAVEAVTGEDPFAPFRPWPSRRAAAASLARTGCRSVAEYLRARFASVAPSEAQRGDVGYVSGMADVLACPAVIAGPLAMSWAPAGFLCFDRALIREAFAV